MEEEEEEEEEGSMRSATMSIESQEVPSIATFTGTACLTFLPY